jgi:hypothetical protein
MGGVARLFAGLDGATLSQLGADFTVVAATTQDNCPAALPYVARWAGVTLPESEEDADGALKTATALRVDVTDVSTTVGPSPVVKLWVDSSAPVIAPNTPVPLCGRIEQSATDASLRVALLSTANDVKLTIQSPSGTNQYTPMARTGAVADFGNLPFQVGENQVSATSIEPAGNTAALASPCVVRVGLVPTVTWEAPVSGANLCAAGGTGCQPDSDAGTPGWQGTLRVLVNVNGAPATTGTVTFLSGDTELATVNIDGTGHAELPNVSLPDANPVTLRARTSDITGTGTGSSTLTVSVDTVPPNAIATLTPVVKLRRQTTFNLQWAAPADGSGGNVASYLVRVSTAAINDGNFAAATNVPFTGAAAAAGSPDAIDVPNLLIEHDYYFAVAPVDSAGNRGPLVTAGPVAAHFNQTIVAAPAGTAANARFGAILDGAADVNGDGRSDMLVGTVSTQNAYIFLGATDFTTAPGPAVTITGPASSAFARSFIDIGDIDADGRSDIAVSAPRSGNGKVYIFKGRTTWNAAYAATAADYTIDLGAAYVGSEFGSSMAKLGDVDGDGVADFAIGAPNYGANRGRVVIVLGKAGFDGSAPSTIIIDGEPSTAGLFGYRIAGSAPMYTTGAGNTVIISAPVAGTNARGRVYTFQGLSTNPGSYDATNARDKVEGGVDNASYGSGTIAPLGPLGASPRALVISSPGIAPGGGQFGYADVWLGAANAPLGTAPKRFISTAATTVADQFGRIASTSLSSGVDAPVNIVGDSSPDLAVVGTTEGGGPARVYLVDGSTIPGLPALNNIVMTSTVTLPLPAGWASVTPYEPSMLLRDVNGDGFGDIAVGEYNTPTLVGRFVVFW